MEKRAEEVLRKYEQAIAKIILQCTSELPFDVGPTRICQVLRGSQAKPIKKLGLDENSMYGILNPYPTKTVQGMIHILIDNRLLDSSMDGYYGTGQILSLNKLGQRYLDGKVTIDDLGFFSGRMASQPSTGGKNIATQPALAGDQPAQKLSYEERMARIRADHPRAYEPWEPKEEQQLRTLYAEGATIKKIARTLQRQPGGIKSRIKKLELDRDISTQSNPSQQALKPRRANYEVSGNPGTPERKSRIRSRPETSQSNRWD